MIGHQQRVRLGLTHHLIISDCGITNSRLKCVQQWYAAGLANGAANWTGMHQRPVHQNLKAAKTIKFEKHRSKNGKPRRNSHQKLGFIWHESLCSASKGEQDHTPPSRSASAVHDRSCRIRPWSGQWVGCVAVNPHVAHKRHPSASHFRLKSPTNPAVTLFIWRLHKNSERSAWVPNTGKRVQKWCEQRRFRTLTLLLSACCFGYKGVLMLATLTSVRLRLGSCDLRWFRTSTMPSSACCLQYTAVSHPRILKFGRFVHDAWKQRLPHTFTMPSSACCLQYIALLLPKSLKLGTFVRVSIEQRPLRMYIIQSSACRLHYTPFLLPTIL